MQKLLATATFVIASQIIFMPNASASGLDALNKQNSIMTKCDQNSRNMTGQSKKAAMDNCLRMQKDPPLEYGKKLTPQQQEVLKKSLEAGMGKLGNN